MRVRLIALIFAFGLTAGPAAAIDSERDGTRLDELERAIILIEAGAHQSAILVLERARLIEPRNADTYNLLGLASRQLGDTAAALAFYRRALAIDPRHLGANEYLGELYLRLDEPGKARERLAILAAACSACEETRELQAAIAAYVGA